MVVLYPYDLLSTLLAVLNGAIAAYAVWWGVKSQVLSTPGAVVTFLAAYFQLAMGIPFGLTMLSSYVSCRKLARFQGVKKSLMAERYDPQGLLPLNKVIVETLGACVSAFVAARASAPDHRRFGIGAFLGHYASSCGDSWASEVGVLNDAWPILITNFKVVPPGTNGGITLLGSTCSAAAGLFIGCCFCTAAAACSLTDMLLHRTQQPLVGSWLDESKLLVLAITSGLAGSTVDSFLGSKFQFNGYDFKKRLVVKRPRPGVRNLSRGWHILNDGSVNFIATSLTSIIAGYAFCVW